LTWYLLAGRESPPLATPDLRGFRIGVAGSFFLDHVQPAVRDAVSSTIETLQTVGADVFDSPWEEAAAARAIGFLLNRAETAVVHGATAHDEPEAFSQYNPDLRLRVAAGRIMPAELYVNSMKGRTVIRDSMARLFREHRLNALLAPALPTTAVPAADMSIAGTGLDEGIGAAWTRLTMPFNTTGQPVLAMPVGFDARGLPIGVQLAGAPGREDELFAIGQVLEAALGVQANLPPMLTTDQQGEVLS
jgi:aspartyl-tRNA(Asn)/glutamyl-tRNA(Gln) amidotransferase subunit A